MVRSGNGAGLGRRAWHAAGSVSSDRQERCARWSGRRGRMHLAHGSSPEPCGNPTRAAVSPDNGGACLAPRARDLGIRIGLLEPGPAQRHHGRARRARRPHDPHLGRRAAGRRARARSARASPSSCPVASRSQEAFFAGCHRLNGNGELTGLEWVRESGMLTTPIAITNTHSVGVVRDALITAAIERGPRDGEWSLPVVGETYDGRLSDMDGQHVRPEHVFAALDAAAGRAGRGGQRGRRHGHDLPRVQGRHRDRRPGCWPRTTAAGRWASWSRPTTAAGSG